MNNDKRNVKININANAAKGLRNGWSFWGIQAPLFTVIKPHEKHYTVNVLADIQCYYLIMAFAGLKRMYNNGECKLQ